MLNEVSASLPHEHEEGDVRPPFCNYLIVPLDEIHVFIVAKAPDYDPVYEVLKRYALSLVNAPANDKLDNQVDGLAELNLIDEAEDDGANDENVRSYEGHLGEALANHARAVELLHLVWVVVLAFTTLVEPLGVLQLL